jgi:hypothetical protein
LRVLSNLNVDRNQLKEIPVEVSFKKQSMVTRTEYEPNVKEREREKEKGEGNRERNCILAHLNT